MSEDKKRIILGSGEIFAKTYNGTMPTRAALCVPENRLGYIQGGATLDYKPSYYDAKDDLGYAKKSIMTEEEASLKSGIMTLDVDAINKLCDTGRVEDAADGKTRTIKIGGIGNAKNESYAIGFWHKDKKDGDLWVVIVGRNQAGFSLSFAKDKETVVDAEFKCEPMDDEGTLIEITEEVKAAG